MSLKCLIFLLLLLLGLSVCCHGARLNKQEGKYINDCVVKSHAGDDASLINYVTFECASADEQNKILFDEKPNGQQEIYCSNEEILSTTVTTLKFEYCDLPILESSFVRIFKNLRYLLLNDMNLERIPADLLQNTKELSGFYARGNKLTSIPNNLFENLDSLRTVDLSFNQITGFDLPLLGLNGLNTLNLSHNRLTSLSSGDTYLLDIMHEYITEVDFSHNNLTQVLRLATNGLTFPRLRSINLSNNRLQRSPRWSAANFPVLDNLHLFVL